ncbi:unnamed protein product [Blepharisma stoltei]|uniref:Uncharacterized protein n=1 Tax=Blepharisma stoltei TaxID=1481888 RepID=A0AAU9IMP2_9CILI|nr:unnamed protein product [Blepharisma stoltei]
MTSTQIEEKIIENGESPLNEDTEPQRDLLDLIDWSSNDDEGASSSDPGDWTAIPFKTISPLIFRKASRRWLASQTPDFYSQEKNTVGMKKTKVLAGKYLQAFENYLASITMMYYGDPYVSKKSEPATAAAYRPGKRPRNILQMDPLAFLLSPLRQEFSFELWSPMQVAVFECGLCSFGKEFKVIEKLLKFSKTYQEVTQFYHMWKQTSHYKVWKECLIKDREYS